MAGVPSSRLRKGFEIKNVRRKTKHVCHHVHSSQTDIMNSILLPLPKVGGKDTVYGPP